MKPTVVSFERANEVCGKLAELYGKESWWKDAFPATYSRGWVVQLHIKERGQAPQAYEEVTLDVRS